MKLLSLIGEQPIPVLLVHRALKPERHIFACTPFSQHVAHNLQTLIPQSEIVTIEPYSLEDSIAALRSQIYPKSIINLTAGTKIMSLAAYEIARHQSLPFVYLRSQGAENVLYHYETKNGEPKFAEERKLPALITINDYLQAHGLPIKPTTISANPQETALRYFFEANCDEFKHNLNYPAFEIDFIIRRRNQVAVVEAKAPKNKIRRFGLDQLTTIAGREYLGTYTGRIWVVNKPLGKQLAQLAKAYNIKVVQVQLVDHAGKWRLDPNSQQRMLAALDEILGKPQ